MQKIYPRYRFLLIFMLISIILAGCADRVESSPAINTAQATATEVPPTVTNTHTVQPPTATFTQLPPTATFTAVPTNTATQVPSDTPTALPTATFTPTAQSQSQSGIHGSSGNVKIFFILLDTGGPVGCGDSLIWVGSGAVQTGDIAEDVNAGLKQLFSYRNEWVGGMYNPLFRSSIKVADVTFDSGSGLITVNLSGSYVQPDDPCDNTRVRVQVWATVRQYAGVTSTNIYLNKSPFGDKLSNGK